jgi:hypothetical protein
MPTFPGVFAVPGAIWPGSIWPGDVIQAAVVTANPVLFSLGRARNGSGFSGTVLTQPATSSTYVQVQVIATLDGVSYDPTVADTLAMAFIPMPQYGAPPNPQPSQWQAASWELDPGPVYWSSILTGPSGVPLTAGAYAVAVQVTDGGVARVMWGPTVLVT